MLIEIIALLSLLSGGLICWLSGGFLTLAWLWILPAGFAGTFVLLAVLYFLFLWLCCALVDMEKPQENDSKLFRVLFGLTARAATQLLLMKVHTKGLEKLPKQGRFLTLAAFFPRSQLAFISKRENDRKFLVGKILHMTLGQPINRENDREALKTILNCIQILKDDKASIAVFPEGYTSLDGLLHPFRGGVFKIAQKANVPIVVCTLQNTNKPFHNAPRLKPTHVHLHLLDVIPAEEIKGIPAVEVANRVHAMMAEDLGPDLVLKEA